MKKLPAILLSLLMLMSALTVGVTAEDTAAVTVTIVDKGTLVLIAETVTVTDTDGDNALTVHDALLAAHEAYYDGEAGYSAYEGDYGLAIGTLWGDISGNFGYYRNNASCRSLTDPVAGGDSLVAFVYADAEYYSDMYTWFEPTVTTVEAGQTLTLTLSGAGFDANWNPITLPVSGAVITVNGEKADAVTDENGIATLTLDTAGEVIVSAVSDTAVLVPPVCRVTVNGAVATNTTATIPTTTVPASPQTGEADVLAAVAAVLVLAAVTVSATNKQHA